MNRPIFDGRVLAACLVSAALFYTRHGAGMETPVAEDPPAAEPPGGQEPASVGAPPDAVGADAEWSDIERALAADRPPGANETERPAPSAAATASIQPDLTIIGDFALAAFSDEDDHQQTGAHDPSRNGFNLQQLELAFGASVDPYFRFDGSLVFGESGVELEEAYATTLALPYRLQLRFGQMATRFGRLNATHPHTWDFVDQPLAIGRVFGAEGSRGLGVELSFLAPLPWFVELVLSATQAQGEGTARSFFGREDLGVDGPEDVLVVTALKQFFELSEAWSLMVGASGAFGPNASGRDNRTDVYGVDVYVKYRPVASPDAGFVALQTEWLYRRRQVPDDVLADVTGYGQLVYRFARRYAVAARYELGTPARDRDGRVAPDPLDPGWSRDRSRVAANLTHYPTEFSRVRLQVSRDTGPRDPVWAAFLAAEVLIGAHGAHAF